MLSKLILAALFFVVIFLQVRSKEFFSFFDINNKKSNCNVTTNILNSVNHHKSEVCTEDDSNPNNDVNNDRLNCRQFEENDIFLSKDRNSWCKDVKNKPQLKENINPSDFTGIGELHKYDEEPRPHIIPNLGENEFPFDDAEFKFLNLDNKDLSK